MSDTAVHPPAQTAQGANRPPSTVPARPERRRQLGWAAGLLLVAAGCALGFALLYQAAGQRQPVLVVARPVAAGAIIGPDDVTVVRVSVDPALRPLAAGRHGEVVGARAAYTLAAGTLLTADHLDARGGVPDGQAVVGVAVLTGDLPSSSLRAGDRVLVVLAAGSAAGAEGEGGQVIGWGEVYAVETADEASGTVRVSLLLREDIAVDVAAAAAADRARLVWIGGAR